MSSHHIASRSFPHTRLRRNRAQEFSRTLCRENQLNAGDLIYPLFVIEGKGEREDWKSYRPVSVTAIEYRILGRAIHQVMQPVVRRVVGEEQVAFMENRLIDENILCVSELARFCDLYHAQLRCASAP